MKILEPLSSDIDMCAVVLSNGLVFFISEHNGGLSIRSDKNMFAEHIPGEVVIRTVKQEPKDNVYGPQHGC